jgi:ATP-binding cassette, subfamily B (MDR/TAP), member 1
VKNPKILLLDEATSALDPTSEKRVQDALDAASRGRTTVTVTHRLSTITNADKIVYINRGRVEEQGSHKELLEKKGFYYELVKTNNEHLTQSQEQSSLHPHRGSRRYSRRKGESFRSVASSVSDVDSDYSDYESDEDEEVVKEEKPEKISTLGIIKMNSKEWPYISIGTFASCIVGASFPAFAVLFGEMYGILSLDDATEVQRYANFYSILFLGLGVITGVSTFIQTYMFNSAGVRLTSRLRSMVFNAMMSQEMSWFDNPKNAVGALCARLSSDCSAVQGASGSRIGSIVQAGSVIIIGIGISFYYNWKMTLVASVSIPLVLISIVAEARLCEKSNIKEKNAIETASKIAIEAISNIRTVASLGQEPHVLKRYVTEIDSIDDYCKQKLRYRGVVFGLGQTVPLMGYAMSLWYGGTLVAYGEMPYQNVIKVGEALIFGSWMLGQALAYAPNVSAAIISASRIMNLLNRKPTIANPQRIVYPSSEVQGEIAFKDVNFCYPSRKDILVLKDLNLQIESGKTVALVGASGSGK